MIIGKDFGRIDYKPRLKKWRAIYYAGTFGERDIKLGDYDTQEEATKILRAKIIQSRKS